VPFVARYRKEATGALDDAQLRTLEERLRYLRELDERRAVVLDSISQQGKLDAALKMRSTRRTARRALRISICPIGRNGGRKLKSRAKRASSRWQRRFSRGPTKTRSRWLAGTSNRVRGFVIRLRLSKAPARSSLSVSPKMPR
jgi:hypothetical protein